MNTMNLIALTIVLSYVSLSSGMVIRTEQAHNIRKRSASAEHSITDATGRHRAVLERQLLLTKLINSVDTSGSSAPVLKNDVTDDVATQAKKHHQHGKTHRRNKSRATRSLERSISTLLKSEYSDDVINAIADVIPDESKTKGAVKRIRKFAKRLACSCMKE